MRLLIVELLSLHFVKRTSVVLRAAAEAAQSPGPQAAILATWPSGLGLRLNLTDGVRRSAASSPCGLLVPPIADTEITTKSKTVKNPTALFRARETCSVMWLGVCGKGRFGTAN